MTLDAKAEAVHRLGQGVLRRTGIKVQPQTEAKLLRIFGSMPPDLLLAWVGELEHLPAEHPEWLAVIENLTVHESFFFRDRTQMEVLRRQILPEILGRARDRTVRVWSAGCACGEEAYSLAILLLETMRDMGLAVGTPETGIRPLPGWTVSVMGTDISRPVLELARQAIYHGGELSPLRSLPPGAEAWFETVEAPGNSEPLYQLRPEVRRMAEFRPFNLIDPLPPARGFDLVLCRNVFIYFAAEAQAAAQRNFAAALGADGILMMGATDRLEVADLFAAEWLGESVVYRATKS